MFDLLDWLFEPLRFLFNDRIDTGWGRLASIYVLIVGACFTIGSVRSVMQWAKASDLNFDKAKLDAYNDSLPPGMPERKINWTKAYQQGVQSFRYSLPFGLLVFAVLCAWVKYDFTWKGYLGVAAGWLLISWLLRLWWIATAVWTDRKLFKVGARTAAEAPLAMMTVREAFKRYMNWGASQSVMRPLFVGRFKRLNGIIEACKVRWLRLRWIWALLSAAFYALIWIISMPIAVFHLRKEFDARPQVLKPAWM